MEFEVKQHLFKGITNKIVALGWKRFIKNLTPAIESILWEF